MLALEMGPGISVRTGVSAKEGMMKVMKISKDNDCFLWYIRCVVKDKNSRCSVVFQGKDRRGKRGGAIILIGSGFGGQ